VLRSPFPRGRITLQRNKLSPATVLFALFLAVSPIIILAAGGSRTNPDNPSEPGLPPVVLGGATEASTIAESQIRLAVVKPIFTTTAYSSFYDFFRAHARTPNGSVVKKDIGLLNATVVDSWGWSDGLSRFLSSDAARRSGLVVGTSLQVLTDIGVSGGALFKSDGSRNYDVLILGFTEYVTEQEYVAYRQFAASGGTIIFMDATNFLAEVRYYPQTNHLSLVKGHGWGFDGKSAWPDQFARWKSENAAWVGSNYCSSGAGNRYDGALIIGGNPISSYLQGKFGPRVFLSYGGHEENCLTNMTGTTVIAMWSQTTPGPHKAVAAYLHRHLKGMVLHLGAMGGDVIQSDPSIQYFMVAGILAAVNQKR
jgi:hypothetical protein